MCKRILTKLQLHGVYRTAITKKVTESHEYRESFILLSHLTALELRNKMASFVDSLEKGP